MTELRRLAGRPVRIRFTIRDDHVTLFSQIAGTKLAS